MYDQYWSNLPRWRCRNVSGKLIPSFAILCFTGVDEDGVLQVREHRHDHRDQNLEPHKDGRPRGTIKGHHTPDHIHHLSAWELIQDWGGEHFACFNGPTPIRVGKRGWVTTHLPAITRCTDTGATYGKVVCAAPNQFECKIANGEGTGIANGWPVIARLNTDLIMVGGIVTFEHFNHTSTEAVDYTGHPGDQDI